MPCIFLKTKDIDIRMFPLEKVIQQCFSFKVLTFENYKKRGPIYLDKASTERLLEQLEDAQALLAQMLTSRHIGPLREEAASWAEKLKEVAQVLETWLEVQDLWQYLEAVFSNSVAAKVRHILLSHQPLAVSGGSLQQLCGRQGKAYSIIPPTSGSIWRQSSETLWPPR